MSTYYAENELKNPLDGFGIWHIHGSTKYKRSIRLGLEHYLNAVSRVRGALGKKSEGFFKSDSLNLKWDPLSTWLNIFFNKKLIIFGIGLAENETFLRWLLLTKYKYIKYLDSRIKLGIYICCKPKEGNKQIIGKHFFLENVGFEIKYINDYKELYN